MHAALVVGFYWRGYPCGIRRAFFVLKLTNTGNSVLVVVGDETHENSCFGGWFKA